MGVHIDTEYVRVFVADGKVKRVHDLVKLFLLMVQGNRFLFPMNQVRRFCGVRISLTLALPLTRFYTSSLFFDMASPRFCKGNGRKRHLVRLSHQSIRDLCLLRLLTCGEGRELHLIHPCLVIHADASTVEYGGTLGPDTSHGSPNLWVAQGFWSGSKCSQSIRLRGLRAVRLSFKSRLPPL